MNVLAYLESHQEETLQRLVAFASIPSVSTDPAYRDGVTRAARWVADQLSAGGMQNVRINPTPGHPIVTADWLGAPGKPTILVYGHYDVQPPDPLEKWKSPPFEPTVRDNRLYARGVSDDKGPMLIPIVVAEAFIRTEGKLPVNVRFIIEGEEEKGSVNLGPFVKAHAAELAADFLLSADGAMWRPDEPSITVASRGIAALEFTVRGAGKDLHSGRHGGAVANPAPALATLVASMHDASGRVAVAGFYDRVGEPPLAVRKIVHAMPFDSARYLQGIGAPGEAGEAGWTLLERMWLRPTLEINGLWGGYQGPGTKTVIPCEAHAKITCRLVPGQRPDEIVAQIAAHLRANCPRGVTLEVRPGDHGSEAYEIPGEHPGLALAEQILEEVYDQKALRVRMGATIPIGLIFRQIGAETVFFSFSTADEDYHAPNEFFRLQRLKDGTRAWARYWQELGRLDAAAFRSAR
jgi:acetylornithine deacetylase/succinyl-diaminopimelate desuccinylase-like protein